MWNQCGPCVEPFNLCNPCYNPCEPFYNQCEPYNPCYNPCSSPYPLPCPPQSGCFSSVRVECNLTVGKHIVARNTIISAVGAGHFIPTVTPNNGLLTDIAGSLLITSNVVAGNGTVVVTFKHAYTTVPVVVLTLASSPATGALSTVPYLSSVTTTGFTLTSLAVNISNSLTSVVNYMVIETVN